MDSKKIFAKIKELGHVHSKRDELQDYCRLKFDLIVQYLPRRILCSDGGDLLDCILNGLLDGSTESCRDKVKIIDIVLQIMRKESTSLTHCGDVISRLCLELPKLPADELVRLCNDCMQYITEDSDVNMTWRDILPECISALSSHNNIKHDDIEMTCDEFKQQCIHKLCQCQWAERQLVQLTAMFKDLQVSRDDHKQVVNKICSYIIDIPPETLPPLVPQLIKLCKLYNFEIVLAHLSHYFSARLYSKLEPPPQDSESTTMDIDDIEPHSPAELSRCLSTCIYHISQGAADPELVRKQIKTWPKTQLLRAPFLLDLALAVSDKGADFRSVCLDAIKSAIQLRAMDELRSRESAWVRSVVPPDVDVASVLKVLTTESANHRQLTVIGLINLAFSLLAVPRVKPAAQTCWSHGKLILVRLSKSQPETAGHILSQLADKLAGDSTQRQYADCLYILCKLTPVSVERCAQLTTILESCQPAPGDYRPAAAVLDAVHPLINFSARTRDTLVMVCRKGLYSRDSVHRRLALSGFLSVLRHTRWSRSAFTTSQSVCSDQYSGHSYLTQLTVDLHATHQGSAVTSRVRNEAVCMEVMSILRRCLGQDAAVKELLYTNLYDCAQEKPMLHETILEFLYEHLSKYLPQQDGGSPLLLDKCVQVTATTAVLIEPISQLLYAVAQFLQPVEEEDLEDILGSQSGETGGAYLKSKLTSVMEQLCTSEHFGKIDLEDPGLTDLTPESKAKYIKVQQILQCYETLIAHQIMQWNVNSSSPANCVYNLFKAYNQLLEQTKVPPKLGKKGSKSLNETRETVKSQKSQKTQAAKGKSANKLSNMVKERAGPFKPLPCVWDLKFCIRILELLYSEEVVWSSLEQRNQVRGKRDFHQWALRSILSTLASEHLDSRAAAAHLVSISSLLYRRCICRFQDMCNFDDQTALGCLEVFRTCLGLLFSPNYSLKMEKFLPTITGLPNSTASACVCAVLEHIHEALAHIDAESGPDRDVTDKKLVAALVQAAASLLDTPVQSLCPVIVKLEEYVRTSPRDCVPLVPALLAAGARDQQEAHLLDELLLKLATVLGKIDEEDTTVGEESTTFPAIDSRSAHAAVGHVCAHLHARLKCGEHVAVRARDLAAALARAPAPHRHRIDKELKEVYRSLVVQLCQLAAWTGRVAALRCAAPAADRVLAVCVRLYALLTALARQLDAPTAHLVRFDRLLKLSGKKLSTVMDNLIIYIEASQQQQSATKVLRDTKLIPRLVLEAEQFSKHVILLANKAKANWQQYLSLGTARDFRIKASVLEEVLTRDKQADVADETRDDDDVDINDAVTEIIGGPASDHEDNCDDDDEENRPRKRRRVS